jgi:ferrous-iron efflux pump FieF
VSVALLLIGVKALAYSGTGAVSILASLVDSVMDAGASLLSFIAVRYALAPADRAHRFGHGKAEAIAALAQALLVVGSGLYLIAEALQRLLTPQPIAGLTLGVTALLFTMAVTGLLLLLQRHVIRHTGSTAIRADALHYRSDLLSNAAVLAAFLLAQLGLTVLDPLFALGVAGYILWSARRILADALGELLDQELPTQRRRVVQDLALAHPQVHGVHDLRSRRAGRVEFYELHLELDDFLPLVDAHRVADEVAAAIRERFPGADVMIHQDPMSISEAQLDEQIAAAEQD